MDELSLDDLKQLVYFYKQKSADLELQNLQLQLKINKINTEGNKVDSFDHL